MKQLETPNGSRRIPNPARAVAHRSKRIMAAITCRAPAAMRNSAGCVVRDGAASTTAARQKSTPCPASKQNSRIVCKSASTTQCRLHHWFMHSLVYKASLSTNAPFHEHTNARRTLRRTNRHSNSCLLYVSQVSCLSLSLSLSLSLARSLCVCDIWPI
jgi:hypothetical protein